MLMNGARPVPEATNSARRPSSWSRNLPFGPLMLMASPTVRSQSSGVNPPASTRRMKNSYSLMSSAEELTLIGRWIELRAVVADQAERGVLPGLERKRLLQRLDADDRQPGSELLPSAQPSVVRVVVSHALPSVGAAASPMGAAGGQYRRGVRGF